jgi:hypothetical protein
MASEENDTMEKIAIAFGGSLMFAGAILFVAPIATLFGAVAGWIVGLFFGETILNVLALLGVHGVTIWQFGAFMGFVGGFLKTKVTAEVKEKN